jgi:putative addiction module component (TIGR02574 family)
MTMSTRFEQLASDAMKLPVRDRVRLAQQLVATIDEDTETATEKEIEELWFAEAERRLDELRSGSVQGVDAEDAFRNARESLKR